MKAWLQISEEFGLHGLSQNWGAMTLSAVISGQLFNLFYGKHLTFSSVFSSHFFFPWQCNNASLAVPKKKIHTPGTGYLHSIIRQNQNYDERKKTAAAGMHISLSQMAKFFFFENPPRYPIIHPICG